jgi:hypothetical protein
MMIRPLLAMFVFSVLCLLDKPSEASEESANWIKYFAGSWKVEGKTWTSDDGWTEETVVVTRELLAGDSTIVVKHTGNWGDTVTVLGIEGHSGEFFEYGAAANGNRWRIVFETVESKKLAGKLMARLGDGTKGEGTLEVIRMEDDTYEYSWQLKLENGKEMKGCGTNKRKRS